MSIIYDLHSHSTASDGTLTPSGLVHHAHKMGVNVLALTDHDSTNGLDEAARAALACPGLDLVNGVEISVTWRRRTIHVVGLGIDIANEQLQAGLKSLRDFRDWRAMEIGRRLDKAGITGSYEGAKALSNGRLIARTHFARFLVASGHARDFSQVFKRFLVSGKPGHVRGDWAELDTVTGWIRAAGGRAVIAHPARYNLTRTKLLQLFNEFRDCGGEAIEVLSGSHSRDECLTMGRHARELELLASAGSDYHGPENAWVEMGRFGEMPNGCVPVWHDWKFVRESAVS